MQLRAIVAGALGFVGVLLLNWGFANETARLTRIPLLSIGFALFLSSLFYLYIKLRLHLGSLRLLDLALIFLCLVMLPVFDLLSGEVLWWVCLVVSCLGARLIISWLLKGRVKSYGEAA